MFIFTNIAVFYVILFRKANIEFPITSCLKISVGKTNEKLNEEFFCNIKNYFSICKYSYRM